MRHILAISLLLSLLSCKNDANKTTANNNNASTATPTTSTPVTPEYEVLPNDVLMEYWNKCTLIDYIFHDLPFSMNQSEQASIRTNLTYIDGNVQPNIPAGCKALARQFYQIDGEILMEADVYFSPGCEFYIFYVGDKKYANKMAQTGKEFFRTMISKGVNAQKQMTQ